ncbi:GNAT family N-acetyltransferase [Salmonirosea aquatica]|uniref:GNAT family N-acetyltransferase n=1 Tax=Salmonirosea aquatica TaxID=2654236 RepID=A0A7C9FXJ4_9BACT|nr:GNAT family N-acetyltransferase [Cytophagaceae bacterium SJW1-29]
MELFTKRLILTEVTWGDVDIIHRLHSLEEVEEYNTIGIPRHTGDTLEVLLASIEDQQMSVRNHYGWTVRTHEDGEFVGEAGMHLSGDSFRSSDIYYSLLPAHWKKGYATEIVKRMIVFGFSELKLHRIQAGVATENVRSIRVLEKAGMVCEGLRRKILPIRGEWKDNYHYAIVEDDPFEK